MDQTCRGPGPFSWRRRRPQWHIFNLGNLPAGEYFLTVVPDEQVVDWQDAPRLEALVRQAQRIVLAAGDKQSVTVKR